MPADDRTLCRLEDIPDGRARGFLPDDYHDRVFAVRNGEHVHVYLNCCPHHWLPLDIEKDQFLADDGRDILCHEHGARFLIGSGGCIDGPCVGEYLIRVPARVEHGTVLIPRELPPPPD